MKRLLLIRHAATSYSDEGRYCGHQNVPLNVNGVRQARYLKQRLKRFRIDKVYSSDLKRCLDTAYILFGKKFISKRKALREINFGALAGLKYNDLKKEYREIYVLWRKQPEKLVVPKGESLSHFAQRVERCFNHIVRKNHKKNIAVVTHGGPIRIILLRLLKKPLNKMWEIDQEPCALNIIDFVKGVPKIKKINDTEHLN